MYRKIFMLSSVFSSDLNKVRAVISMRDFGLSMLQIFAPIFLVSKGYSWQSVVWMFFAEAAVYALLMVPLGKVAASKGFRPLARISGLLAVFYLTMLYVAGNSFFPLVVLGLIKGIANSFYYPWYHIAQAQTSTHKFRGVQIAWTSMSRSLCVLPAPIIGGFILEKWGIGVLIFIVTFVLLFAFRPLFLMTEEEKDVSFSGSKIFKNRNWREYVVFGVNGMDNMIHEWIWPLYIFFAVIGSYEVLGIVAALTVAFSLVTNLVAGKWSDKNGKAALGVGATMSFFGLVVRPLITTSGGVYAINSFDGVAHKFIGVSVNSRSYDIAKEKGVVEYMLFREITTQVGRMLLYLLILSLNNWSYVFVVVAFMYLSYFFLYSEKISLSESRVLSLK